MNSFEIELPYWQKGLTIIGVDEVGRGCLAGPVTVGAVAFAPDKMNIEKEIENLNIKDSKQVSREKRELLSPIIKTYATTFSTATSSVEIINENGIVFAIAEAMNIAIENCIKCCQNNKFVILIDGATLPILRLKEGIEKRTIIKGDTISISIASAAIIAKVERDALMDTLSVTFPAYGWDQNKGYGTLNHRNSIKKNGLTKHHRALFVRNIVEL